MIIKFDPKLMHLQVICGILEKYEPSEKINSIYAKVEELKQAMIKFNSDVLTPGLNEINVLIEEENKKYAPEQKKS